MQTKTQQHLEITSDQCQQRYFLKDFFHRRMWWREWQLLRFLASIKNQCQTTLGTPERNPYLIMHVFTFLYNIIPYLYTAFRRKTCPRIHSKRMDMFAFKSFEAKKNLQNHVTHSPWLPSWATKDRLVGNCISPIEIVLTVRQVETPIFDMISPLIFFEVEKIMFEHKADAQIY